MYRVKRKSLMKKKNKSRDINIKQYISDYEDILKLYNILDKNLYLAGYSINADKFIVYDFVAFLVEIFVFSFFTHSVFIGFVFALFVTVMSFIVISSFAKSRKQKMLRQFPAFIKAFINEFSVNQNLKHVFNNIYNKIPKPLDKPILNLTMKINNSSDITEPIKEFKAEMDDIYVTVFCELLVIYNEKGGQLIEYLDTLLNLIEDEEMAHIQKSSEMTSVILYLPLLGVVALVALVLNFIYLPITKKLFFETSQGQFYFGIGILCLIVGFFLSLIMYYQNRI